MKIGPIVPFVLLCSAICGQAQTVKSSGTQQIFGVNQIEAERAISNAFGRWAYKGMDLISARGEGTVPGWHGTNGWILFPLSGPTTVTPWKNSKELVPYIPTFHITVQPLGSNRISIAVRTIDARVIHGKEIGIHGGWANHEVDVAPALSEETNVLSVISNAVVGLKEGGTASAIGTGGRLTQPIPATPFEQEAIDAAKKAAEAARSNAGGTNQH